MGKLVAAEVAVVMGTSSPHMLCGRAVEQYQVQYRSSALVHQYVYQYVGLYGGRGDGAGGRGGSPPQAPIKPTSSSRDDQRRLAKAVRAVLVEPTADSPSQVAHEQHRHDLSPASRAKQTLPIGVHGAQQPQRTG